MSKGGAIGDRMQPIDRANGFGWIGTRAGENGRCK
jgi:hypothetical protein